MQIIKKYITNNGCYQWSSQRIPIGIQLHSIGTATANAMNVINYWNQPGVEAAVTYIVDANQDGIAYQILPEEIKTWADAGWANSKAITIEMAESGNIKYTGGANYVVLNESGFKSDFERVYKTTIELIADICKRYGWNPKTKLSNGLYLLSSHNEGRLAGLSSAHVDPEHMLSHFGLTMDNVRSDVIKAMKGQGVSVEVKEQELYRVRKSWEDASSQIGAYSVLQNAKDNCAPGYGVYDSKGKEVYRNNTKVGTQAVEFLNLSETEAAAKILEAAKKDYEKTGILASITSAQAILESGYGKTQLAQEANNFFGMKANLSSNSWESVWDGKSVYNIETAEEYTPGDITNINADFRKYPDFETSMEDHGRYLLGAMNGNQKRYKGLTEAKNYLEAITIIKNGGYATDSKYISKICSIIERYGLDKYDKTPTTTNTETSSSSETNDKTEEQKAETKLYRVRKSWKNSKSQVGAFADLNNAIAVAKEEGLKVFDPDGKQVYPKKSKSTSTKQLKKLTPKYYRVQIGRYLVHENAKRMMATLNKKGFDAMIVKDGAEEIVQAGLFKVEDNANNLAAQIGNAGLPVAVIPIY